MSIIKACMGVWACAPVPQVGWVRGDQWKCIYFWKSKGQSDCFFTQLRGTAHVGFLKRAALLPGQLSSNQNQRGAWHPGKCLAVVVWLLEPHFLTLSMDPEVMNLAARRCATTKWFFKNIDETAFVGFNFLYSL